MVSVSESLRPGKRPFWPTHFRLDGTNFYHTIKDDIQVP